MSLTFILESLIFASDKPLSLKKLQTLTASSDTVALREALTELTETYEERGIQMVKVSGGYHFRTNPDNSSWVRKLLTGRPPRLTRAMLETLAIVAYRQPVTRPEVEDIRGVDCGGVLRTLLDRRLIRIVGKKEEPGRPLLYGTTKHFLEFFHLRDLKDMPTLKEFTELSEDHTEQVEGQFGAPPEEEPAPQDGEPGASIPPEEEQAEVRGIPLQDEEEDTALAALDRALDRVKTMEREHKKVEKARQEQEQAADSAEQPAEEDKDGEEPAPQQDPSPRDDTPGEEEPADG